MAAQRLPALRCGRTGTERSAPQLPCRCQAVGLCPAHVVDGPSYPPDKMPQGRILAYPRCPFAVNNYQRDGYMRIEGDGAGTPNYFPDSVDNITPDPSYKNPPREPDGLLGGHNDRHAEGEADHYNQPGIF